MPPCPSARFTPVGGGVRRCLVCPTFISLPVLCAPVLPARISGIGIRPLLPAAPRAPSPPVDNSCIPSAFSFPCLSSLLCVLSASGRCLSLSNLFFCRLQCLCNRPTASSHSAISQPFALGLWSAMAIPHVHPSARLHLHLSVAPVPRLSPLRNAAGQLPLSTGGLSVGGQHMPSRVRPPVCLLCMRLCFPGGVSPLFVPSTPLPRVASSAFALFRFSLARYRSCFSRMRNANSSPHLLPPIPHQKPDEKRILPSCLPSFTLASVPKSPSAWPWAPRCPPAAPLHTLQN